VTPLLLLALLNTAAGATVSPEVPGQALVVVALPANATHAMSEALNRLRGEALAVGFEVRLVDATTETLSLAQLESISAGLRPAAVVAIARPRDGMPTLHALEVWFQDRGSGKASVAYIDAGDVADAPERTEVVVAVRAVDFIRARMFDTLASRRSEPPSPQPPPAPSASPPAPPREEPVQRYDLAIGVAVLRMPSGFSPSLTPQIVAAFRPAPWLRLGLSASGLGGRPEQSTDVGTVRLEQRFIGAWLGLLGPTWHRLQPTFELGGGEHWLVASGDGKAANVGLTETLSSPAISVVAGLIVELLPYLALELRSGTLWLQSRDEVCAPETACFSSLGRPLWWGSVLIGARL
jgi:hypothetical protein